jgi:hypothetical protein
LLVPLRFVVRENQLKIIPIIRASQRSSNGKAGRPTLSRTIQKLGKVFENRSDVRGQAHPLHDWLIAQAESDQPAAGANALMVSFHCQAIDDASCGFDAGRTDS